MRGVRGPGWAATHPQKLVAAGVAGGVPRLPQQPPRLLPGDAGGAAAGDGGGLGGERLQDAQDGGARGRDGCGQIR